MALPSGAPRPRVAVALGGGGARGHAHVGVLQVLEERGYEVVSLAGSSMGALVGGLHAAGRLDAYADWVQRLTHRDVLRLYDLARRGPGAIHAEKIFAKVGEILDGARIEDLPLPFTAVVTDLMTGEELWFRDGPVDAAIRASAALPGFITPVVVGDRVLADGALTNPLPLAATAGAGADLTVAVAVSGPSRSRSADGEPAALRLLDVLELSLGAVRTAVMRSALADHPPDVLITVPRSSCRTLDFHKAEAMIALGRRLAVEALDREPPASASAARAGRHAG